jgi:hypothetical protein
VPVRGWDTCGITLGARRFLAEGQQLKMTNVYGGRPECHGDVVYTELPRTTDSEEPEEVAAKIEYPRNVVGLHHRPSSSSGAAPEAVEERAERR